MLKKIFKKGITVGLVSIVLLNTIGFSLISYTNAQEDINSILGDIGVTDDSSSVTTTNDIKSQYNLLKQFLGFLGLQIIYDVSENFNPLFYKDRLKQLAGSENIIEILTKVTMTQAENLLGITPIALIVTMILFGVVLYIWVNVKVGENVETTQTQNRQSYNRYPTGGFGDINSFGYDMGGSKTTQMEGGVLRAKDVFTKMYKIVKSNDVDNETKRIARILLGLAAGMIVATIFFGSMAFDYALTLAKNFKLLYYMITSVIIAIIFWAMVSFYIKFILPPIISFLNAESQEENLLSNLVIRGFSGLLVVVIAGGLLGLLINVFLSV